jgi:hypothetical protein
MRRSIPYAAGRVGCFVFVMKFESSAQLLCAAQELSESQILNANPGCKEFGHII